jgi:hypothetical protein
MFNLVEEFPSARPSHVLKLGAVATLIVLLTIAAYVLLNPLPPGPVGQVLDIKLYTPPAPASEAVSENGAEVVLASATLRNNPLLVLTPVKIENTGDQPFSIFDLFAVVRFSNGEYESADVSAEDFQKVFQFYPELVGYQQQPLLRNSVIQPGETAQGLLIFNYPLTEEQWDLRKSFEVKASFDHGKDIVLSDTDTPESWPRLNAQGRQAEPSAKPGTSKP